MYQNPFWESINVVPLLLKKFTTFYGTCWFNSMFTRAHQMFPSLGTLILSLSSHPIYLKLILELSCHLRLGLRNGLLLQIFPVNTLYTFLFFTICTRCPTISFSKCVSMGQNISLNEFYYFCFKCFLISWICVQDYLFKKLSPLIGHYIQRIYIHISILMKIFIVKCLEQYQIRAETDGLPGG